MQRILVIGSSGAGKTTFASDVGRLTGLPVIHLDKLFWKPGWRMTPSDEWTEVQRELVSGESWIIDGTFDGTLEVRMSRADTVIFLDYPRWLCMWRACRRIARDFGRVRAHMAEGCPERVDSGFIRWVWRYRVDIYPNIKRAFEKFPAVRIITLQSPRKAREFLARIRENQADIPA